jgi:hypothetical protein
MTIEEALEHRDTLADIATELYGDFYITHPKFWNSPTELQMREIEELLFESGIFDDIQPTPEEIALAEIIMEEFKLDKEFDTSFSDEDEENEDFI